MESHVHIDEAEASREIYRVHLPGAENDLCSLRELRQLALSKVITPGTLISKEGGNVQTPARSIPSVFSHRSTRVALALWFIGLEQLYLGDIRGFFIRVALLVPLYYWLISVDSFHDIGSVVLILILPFATVMYWGLFFFAALVTSLTGRWDQLINERFYALLLATLASISLVFAGFIWLTSGYRVFTRTAVDREGRPLLD